MNRILESPFGKPPSSLANIGHGSLPSNRGHAGTKDIDLPRFCSLFFLKYCPIFSLTEILKYRQLTLVHRRKSMANLDPSYALKTFASLLIH